MPPISPFRSSCLALAVAHAFVTNSNAANISVNSTVDNEVDDAECTLREAIISANTDSNVHEDNCVSGSGVDQISFDINGTIPLNSALPQITQGLEITGPSPVDLTVSGSNSHRVFEIALGSTVVISDMTISSGSTSREGGGVLVRGMSNLTLNNTLFSQNMASEGGAIALISDSKAVMNNSTVTGNSSTSFGGGAVNVQGSSITLNNSRLLNNWADTNGGGIAVYEVGSNSGSLIVNNSAVSENYAKSLGGAMYANRSRIEVFDSTVSNNSTNGDGGGISGRANAGIYLTNSTVSGNSAGSTSDDHGGALTLSFASSAGLTNATVIGNSAGGYGGGFHVVSSRVNTTNSLISGNMAATSAAEVYSNGVSSGVIADNNNLFGNDSTSNTNAFANFIPGDNDINANSDASNIALTSIIDTSLADNGCSNAAGVSNSSVCVPTHKLVSGSPAIAAADTDHCPDRDQRRRLRSEGFFVAVKAANGNVATFDLGEENCDIGAVEYLPGD